MNLGDRSATSYITHMHVKSVFDKKLVDSWKLTMYTTLNRLAINNLTATRNEFYNRVYNHLGRALEAHDSTYSLWVNTRGERHITVTVTISDVAKMKFRVAVPSLRTPEEIKSKARYDLGCLIGEISQDFYACSYNDFDVFVAWKSKSLNEHWEKYMVSYERDATLRNGGMKRLFDEYANGSDFDWELLLDNLYAKAEGWPTDWLATYQTVEELSSHPAYRY